MIFREAYIKDIPALSVLRLSVKENALSDPTRITYEMYENYLTGCGRGWLCEIDGETAGFSVASSEDASIWALFVDERFEARGIGKRLLKLATDWLFDTGADVIHLTTAVNTRADGFYESLGWKRGEIGKTGEVFYTLKKPK
ncbi:MAG: GNAT family N-acetyltransferase [Pyrinomonadaceae bacterium]